eukprot:7383047-Prymnesium_polylepis.1
MTIAYRPVCQKYFLHVLQTSRSALMTAQKHGTAGRKQDFRQAPKEQFIVQWLDELANFGDRMPDSRNVHIPYASVQAVWDLYREDNISGTGAEDASGSDTDGDEPSGVTQKVSRSYFLKVWKEKRNFIRLQGGSPFAKCDKCEELDELARKHRTNRVQFEAAKWAKAQHIAVVKAERQ